MARKVIVLNELSASHRMAMVASLERYDFTSNNFKDTLLIFQNYS